MDGIVTIIAIIMNLLGSPFNYEGVDDDLGIFAGTYLEKDENGGPFHRQG